MKIIKRLTCSLFHSLKVGLTLFLLISCTQYVEIKHLNFLNQKMTKQGGQRYRNKYLNEDWKELGHKLKEINDYKAINFMGDLVYNNINLEDLREIKSNYVIIKTYMTFSDVLISIFLPFTTARSVSILTE